MTVASSSLIGLGVSPMVADLLGGDPNVLTTAGTTQGTAATIKSKLTELSTAASQTGAILPTGQPAGATFSIFNGTATSAVLYPPTGQYLNGTQNGSLTIAQNKAVVVWQYKPNYWASVLSA